MPRGGIFPAVEVGIGLPNAVRGVDRRGTVEWARRAEAAGFSSLGTIDRMVFPSYESLIALTAAAAVTERIKLVTDILIAPLRSNTVLFAKQTATLNHLSEGRLELGLAVGGREDDFEVSGVDFSTRGGAFDRQLEELGSLWDSDRVAPRSCPALLMGGASEAAYRRAARHADGWTLGGGPPEVFEERYPKVRAAWEAAGRDGEPRTMALFYFALGERAEEDARADLLDYYGYLGEHAQGVVDGAAKDEATVRRYLAGFEEVGVDEVICFPTSIDPEQVDLLAEAVR
jgi:alkanesulfonate monooxygenase SsuD/methylene tetrahydromethanopterin reductase-like flavin-dependent oxidoreductase (luciferase family)